MRTTPQSIEPDDSANSGQSPRLRPWRFLDLFRQATSRMLIRAAIATAIAWVPLAVLSVLHGHVAFLSFLTDFAMQSRILIIVPVLILGESAVRARYALVAHHFETSLIADNEQSKFYLRWRSYENLIDSTAVRVLLLLLTYALAAWLSEFSAGGALSSRTGGKATAVSGFSHSPARGQCLSAIQFSSTSRLYGSGDN